MTYPLVKFGDVVHLNTDRIADPVAAGIERYVGLEHITPGDLHIHSWGSVAEGTTFKPLQARAGAVWQAPGLPEKSGGGRV